MRAEPGTLLEKAGKIKVVHACYVGESCQGHVLLEFCGDVLQYTIQAITWHSATITHECWDSRCIPLRKIDRECRRNRLAEESAGRRSCPGLGMKSLYQPLNLRVFQGKTIDELDPFTAD